MARPLELWTSPAGPNSWKVLVILEELKIPYECRVMAVQEVKQHPFLDLNPNGRAPALVDPNTDLVLWESGAIIQYVIDQYDSEHKLTYNTLKERSLLNQWLMFQMSGQGPYFGQAAWFKNFHSEKLPSAITRYGEQVHRVLTVLEGHLSGSDPARDGRTGPRKWLVGEKMTYADLAFVAWNHFLAMVLPSGTDGEFWKPYPHVQEWHERMESLESMKKLWKMRDEHMAQQHPK